MWWCVAACCSVLQCDRFWSDWRVPTHILRQLRCVAACCSVLQRVAVCCSVIVSGATATFFHTYSAAAQVRFSVLQYGSSRATGALPIIFCSSSDVCACVCERERMCVCGSFTCGTPLSTHTLSHILSHTLSLSHTHTLCVCVCRDVWCHSHVGHLSAQGWRNRTPISHERVDSRFFALPGSESIFTEITE